MITIDQATSLIIENTKLIEDVEIIDLANAAERVLARDISSPLNLPHFDNSAMDGYAVRALDTENASDVTPKALTLTGEIRAGDNPESITVRSGECVRIMTGAPVPDGADAVVMVERTREIEDQVQIYESVCGGKNIRYKGEDVRQGEKVLDKGVLLRPAEIGLAAALGIETLNVWRRPRVGIISTGDEIIEVGQPLPPGKIYDSNRWMLREMIRQSGAEVVDLGCAEDSMMALRGSLDAAISQSLDVVVTIGGVSAGRYDLVGVALVELGFEKIFHKVAIKPGKPFLFCRNAEGILAFGLPGNPVSSMIIFDRFCRPSLARMQRRPLIRNIVRAIMSENVEPSTDGRTHLMRVAIETRDGHSVAIPLPRQGSHMLTSVTRAAGYVEVATSLKEGAEIDVIRL